MNSNFDAKSLDLSNFLLSLHNNWEKNNFPILSGQTLGSKVISPRNRIEKPLITLGLNSWKQKLRSIEHDGVQAIAKLLLSNQNTSITQTQIETNKKILTCVQEALHFAKCLFSVVDVYLNYSFEIRTKDNIPMKVLQTIGGSLMGLVMSPIQLFRGLAGVVATAFGNNKILIDTVGDYKRLGEWMRSTANNVSPGYSEKLNLFVKSLDSDYFIASNCQEYALESSIMSKSTELAINHKSTCKYMMDNWKKIFKKSSILHNLYEPYQNMVSGWLISILSIHGVRELLAKVPTVGIIGLTKAGKSTLVKKLFDINTITGKGLAKRTVVPKLYPVKSLPRLLIIDYPGGDDKDINIQKLLETTMDIGGFFVIVMEWQKARTIVASSLLSLAKKSNTPFLLCLNQADELFKESKESPGINTLEQIKELVDAERRAVCLIANL